MKGFISEQWGRLGDIKDRVINSSKSEKQRVDQLRGSADDMRLHKTLQNLYMRRGSSDAFSTRKHIIERDLEDGSKQFDVILRLDENEQFATDIVISFNWQDKKDRKAGISKGFNIFVNSGSHKMASEGQFTLSDDKCMSGDPKIRNFDALLTYLNTL